MFPSNGLKDTDLFSVGLRCYIAVAFVPPVSLTAVSQNYESASLILICVLLWLPTVPGAPPRRVEVKVLNSTAIKVMWRSLTPGKQNGQIRGYQVHYVRVENGESRGLPVIKDVMLADAQV